MNLVPYKLNLKSLFRIQVRIWVVLFIIFHLTIDSYSQISFAPYKTYTTGSNPRAVCIGDINNDGLNDVLLGTGNSNDPVNKLKLLVFLQDNQGNLSNPLKYDYLSTFYEITSIFICDMNNDHLNDVVIHYGNTIGIFYQNSSGTLNPFKIIYTGTTIYSLSVGDLDNDGIKDIALYDGNEGSIIVFYQKSIDVFTQQKYAASRAVSSNYIIIADINNDQKNDIILMAVNQFNGGGVYIYTQNNFGTLNNYISYNINNVWGQLSSMAVGDLNNDGINDVVLTADGNTPNCKVLLMFQDPYTHQLQNPIQIPAYDIPDAVKIADLNCDSKNEIIVGHSGWDAVSTYEQNYTGNYNAFSKFLAPSSFFSQFGISVGDINNDGKKDVAVANYDGNLIVLINQSNSYGSIPKPPIPSGESNVCGDNKISTYKTLVANDDHVIWNLFSNQTGKIILSKADSCQVLWNNSWRGKAAISVKVTNNCASKTSDTLYIISNRLPSLNLGNDTTLCKNNTITLHAGLGFTTYKWQDNSFDSIYHVTKGGKYYIDASNNCGTRHDTVKVTEVPLPQINCKDTFLCSGIPVQMNAVLPGNHTYRWQDNATDPLYTINKPGNYALTITDDYLCVNSKSFEVKEVFTPSLRLPNDTSICKQDKLVFDAYNPGCRYIWQDGSTSPQYSVEKDGVYAVTVSNECASVTKSAGVSIINCNSYLDVPSAFSPNGDGLNDILYAVGTNVDNIRFIIYNRWGQQVFESSSLDMGWDGTFQGKKLETSVFIYYITGKSTADGHLIQKHGNVSLVR